MTPAALLGYATDMIFCLSLLESHIDLSSQSRGITRVLTAIMQNLKVPFKMQTLYGDNHFLV